MTNHVKDVERYESKDLATKYKKTYSQAGEKVDADVLAAHLVNLDRDGYLVVENVLSPQQLQAVRREVTPLLQKKGRNFFEGELTQRIYSVIAKTLTCNPLVENPMVLALLDEVLKPDYLLSQLQVINILPGESQQPIHFDDGFYDIARPRRALGAATVLAIDDFTQDNGATMVIPGSHKWGDRMPTDEDLQQQISCEMPAGSAVFFLGTLWHGGGENRSKQPRLAATAQYCEGFCRSQENFSLSVPPERVAQCSEDIVRLLGYSIYGTFMGMVNGQHPKRLLEPYSATRK